MKRIITLALAAGLFMGATASANAAEVNVSGQWYMVGAGSDALQLQENNGNGNNDAEFNVHQRIVVDVDIVNSENLSAKIQFRAPSNQVWGADPFGVGGGNWALDLRKAYIDWYIPTTDVLVRMGKQGFFLPTTFGSAVLDNNAAGISVVAPINDNFAITAHWARPVDEGKSDSTSIDLFALTAPFANENFSITPWAAYAMGPDATDTTLNTINPTDYSSADFALLGENNFWIGFASEFTMFDPFTFKLGAMYGASENIYGGTNLDSDGWLVDMQIEYATAYGTPAFLAWYASGDDSEGDLGRIPVVSSGWAASTSAFFDQSQASIAPTSSVFTPTGTWAVGLCWTGFQPMEDLTMGAHALWINGTNDDARYNGTFDPQYLTEDDSVIELAVFGSYDIYKDLQALAEINYLIADSDRANANEENGYRAVLGFKYSF